MTRTVLLLDLPGSQLGELASVVAAQAGERYVVRSVDSLRQLRRELGDHDSAFAVLVSAANAGAGGETGDVVGLVRRYDPQALVVVVADQGNVRAAAAAIESGATDFLVRGNQLSQRVATLLGKLSGLFDMIERTRWLDRQNAELRAAIAAPEAIVGRSPQVKKLVETIRRVAAVPRPVLIIGERGTGKELVARAIHAAAGSPERPLVTVNCAAFSDTLLESELFGHERGAFTGAEQIRRGKFEQADRGTLFLDEIGHMSLPFQQKILRVVEYGKYTRVGGSEELTTHARIIAATNCDLRARIAAGEFLADLYDRLSFEVVEVPPLRKRKNDIEALARFFLERFAQEIPAFAGKTLAAATVTMLNEYDFPGNVRELKNIIERAAYRDTTNEINPEDVGWLAAERAQASGSFTQKVDDFSRQLINDALVHARGNQAQAARDLGLSYDQFRYYLKKYGGSA